MNQITRLSFAIIVVATNAVFAQELPKLTTLSNGQKYSVPKTGYHVLKAADVEAVVIDNSAADDDVLAGHRAGYSGVAKLTHKNRKESIFVPSYAGLNYEHIHDGTTRDRDILFEPRRAPMQTRVVAPNIVELYQAPTPTWKLESVLRYEMLADGTIEMTLECIPHAKTFRNGYIGLFWASYIHQPESMAIHFRGRDAGEKGTARWIKGVTPKHGVLSTHLGANDNRTFKHDKQFPLTLVFNRSKHRFTEPWYYGVNHSIALVQMFRPQDQIRLTQSPSGGGSGNPAWDFQFVIPDYKVGQRYQMVTRAMYVPFKSKEQISKDSLPHRKALGHAIKTASKDKLNKTTVNEATANLEKAGATLKRDLRGAVTSVSLARRNVSVDLLKSLNAFSELKDLSLYETRITDRHLDVVAECSPQLTRLNLGFCQQITDTGLKSVLSLKELTYLNLGFCRKLSAESIGMLAKLHELESLNLSITETDDDALAKIGAIRSLRELDIDATQVTDEGLAKLTKLKQLRFLRLAGTAVTDRGLKYLGSIDSLRHLNVSDTQVTESGIALLRKELPKCIVKR
jgi:hypothetical protein